MLSNFFAGVKQRLDKGDIPSPFLFLSEESELFHHELHASTREFLQDMWVDENSFFVLEDTGESLGIKEVKNFISQANMRARFDFQFFLIENIARMTPEAQNACLKFFEEPGKWNIVFLTAMSEAGILETVLSRVQKVSHLQAQKRKDSVNDFYYSMIESHVRGTSDELVRYFFSGKYEKEEYMEFLKSLLVYITHDGDSFWILESLEQDMQGIMKHNFSARYVVDSYIIQLGS